jgi:hypothetical protein
VVILPIASPSSVAISEFPAILCREALRGRSVFQHTSDFHSLVCPLHYHLPIRLFRQWALLRPTLFSQSLYPSIPQFVLLAY